MFKLRGEYTHNVDAKGRVALPASFRKKIPTDLVVTYDLKQQCLYVFDDESYDSWVEGFFKTDEGEFNQRSESQLQFRRTLKRRSFDVSQDTAGRICIPADMRQKVGIEKEVVIIGNDGYFEIWNKERLDEVDGDVDLTSMFVD